MFKDWEAKYVGRNSNVAAHLLARNANFVSYAVIWVEDTPCNCKPSALGCNFNGLLPLLMNFRLSFDNQKKRKNRGAANQNEP